jgi:hypothetical protein
MVRYVRGNIGVLNLCDMPLPPLIYVLLEIWDNVRFIPSNNIEKKLDMRGST